MQILGLLGMYFDAVVVEVKTFFTFIQIGSGLPIWQKGLGWPCLARSALKRSPVQDFNYLFIMFYCIISTTYPKIGDLFCPVHISGLSHSVIEVCMNLHF